MRLAGPGVLLMMNNDLILTAETGIRQYLAEQPDAADAIEGIHHWWIQ
jgi:hypothetical protein